MKCRRQRTLDDRWANTWNRAGQVQLCFPCFVLFFNASDIKLARRVADVGSDLKSQAVEFDRNVLFHFWNIESSQFLKTFLLFH